ncbi:MAG: cupin domain-containing protein [Candidatus Puniceispirillum sp.]
MLLADLTLQELKMARSFRRVVTGHDQNGVAIVESDTTASQILQRPNRPGVTLTNFWLSDGTPAEYDGATETCTGSFILHPPAGGSVFRCVEFEPEDPEILAGLDGRAAFAEMGAADNIVDNARHPFMHRTDSVDYAIILTGEIYMLLDDEDVLLKAGDVVIQRGTNHAWSNRGTETCVIAFVLVDGVIRRDAAGEMQKGIPRKG